MQNGEKVGRGWIFLATALLLSIGAGLVYLAAWLALMQYWLWLVALVILTVAAYVALMWDRL